MPLRAVGGRRARAPGRARACGSARLQPRRPDQDRHRGQRARAQHARLRRRRRRRRSRCLTTASAQGLRLTFDDQGPGIADIELALKDGYTTGGGWASAWAARSGCPTSSRSSRRPARARGSRSRAGSDEPCTIRVARAIAARSAVAAARAAPRAARAHAWASTTTAPGKVGARRHRAGHQSAQARAAAASIAAARRSSGTASHGVEVLALDHGPGMADVAREPARRLLDAPAAGHGPRRDAAPVATSFDVYSAAGTRHGRALERAGRGRCRAPTPRALEVGARLRADAGRGRRAATPGRSQAAARPLSRAGRRRARPRPAAREAAPRGACACRSRSMPRARRPARSSDRVHGALRAHARRGRRGRATSLAARERRRLRRRRQHRAARCTRTTASGTWSRTTARRARRAQGAGVRVSRGRRRRCWSCTPTACVDALGPRPLSGPAASTHPGADRRGALSRLCARPRRRHASSCCASELEAAAMSTAASTVCRRLRAGRRRRAPARAPDRRRCSASTQDQTRIATAVSEIARNAFRYAGGGRVEFASRASARRRCCIVRVERPGPGIADLDDVLSGPLPLDDRHGPRPHRRAPADGSLRRSTSAPKGTTVTLRQAPARARTPVDGRQVVERIDRRCARQRARRPRSRSAAAEPGAAARARRAARAAGASCSGSTASSRTPTAASSRSTPSSTRRPTTCAAPTR